MSEVVRFPGVDRARLIGLGLCALVELGDRDLALAVSQLLDAGRAGGASGRPGQRLHHLPDASGDSGTRGGIDAPEHGEKLGRVRVLPR
jgi:hypothetical protein